MAHRLFHSLVFSSVMALEGLGCAFSHSHETPGEPDPPEPRTMGDGATPDARVPDAERDSEAADAGTVDTGAADTSAADTGAPFDGDLPDGSDPRFCEPGWPTTKASFCRTIEEEDMPPRIECCSSVFPADGGRGETCCTPRPE